MPNAGNNHAVTDRKYTAAEALRLHHCRWCGKVIDDLTALYCSATHQTVQRKKRARKLVNHCPHPEKVAIRYRGAAVLLAQYHDQHFYLCKCGVYHLTSQQPNR